MIDTINQVAGLAYTVSSNYPEGMITRLKTAAAITMNAIPSSIRETRENIKGRTLKVGILAALTTAQVYGDDGILFTEHNIIKEATDNSVLYPWLAVSATAFAVQAGLGVINQNHVKKYDHGEASEAVEGMNRRQRVGRHIGKLWVSLVGLGVPGHVIAGNMSRREIIAHSAVWATLAPAFYEGIRFGLGPLDSQAAPVAIAGLMVGTRYINESCSRAAMRAGELEPEQVRHLSLVPDLIPQQTSVA